ALQRWIAAGKGLAILAFRGRFAGALWSEQRNSWIGHISVEQRPFYVLVLAESDAAVSEVLRRLSPQVRGRARELRFSGAAAECRIESAASNFFEKADTPTTWVFLSSAEREAADAGRPVGVLRCAIPAAGPLATVEADPTVEYRAFDGARFGPFGPPPPGTQFRLASAKGEAGGSSAELTAQVPPQQPNTRFGFYHVRLAPRPGQLKADVEALSTDSDLALEAAEKTYRFSWLVEHLARAQFARTVPPTSFSLTMQNAEQ
ncbi:MAG: hypothetical protein M3P24_07150, partial [Gemmatimonadota bacterium]|nr:hypothetical protein [Gemmatimonadota bacterium]